MVRLGLAGLLVAALLTCPVPVRADAVDRAAVLKGEWLERSVSLTVRSVPLDRVFEILGKMVSRKFVVESDLGYPVSLEIQELPVLRVLEVLGDSQSLVYREEGATVYVKQVLPSRVGSSAAAR